MADTQAAVYLHECSLCHRAHRCHIDEGKVTHLLTRTPPPAQDFSSAVWQGCVQVRGLGVGHGPSRLLCAAAALSARAAVSRTSRPSPVLALWVLGRPCACVLLERRGHAGKRAPSLGVRAALSGGAALRRRAARARQQGQRYALCWSPRPRGADCQWQSPLRRGACCRTLVDLAAKPRTGEVLVGGEAGAWMAAGQCAGLQARAFGAGVQHSHKAPEV